MSKPLADHGTTARAKGRPSQGIKGCTCEPCRDAEARYDKRRRYLNATGRTVTIAAEPVADHINTLFDAGAGWTQLAAATNCSTATLADIRNGNTQTVRRTTANKILAVRPGEAQPPRRPIDATGTIRRIQALVAIGHSLRALAAESGSDYALLRSLLRSPHSNISRLTADRVACAYRKLAGVPGLNQRARNRAAAEGWPSPLAWGDNIDDPQARPDCEAGADQITASQLAAARAADIRHLGRFGIPHREIAARVGVTEAYVRAQLAGHRLPGRPRTRLQEAA
ncbi:MULTISPECIES: helix-turn-helix domain-containing protein [Streptomyces]|uniref:helix-turn-helix domain-containing protein n=1 Tax=Streptomyces TaxID=1883 RepID=UPI0004C4F1A2|nr:helix-turn-helix transcriptional regulator [Streptomyces sp. NRRL S-1868]